MKIGDIVQLNSGGPDMTVTAIDGDTITATWQSDDGEQSAEFLALTVRPVSQAA